MGNSRLKSNPKGEHTSCGSSGGLSSRNTEILPRHTEAELGKPKLN